MNHATDPPETAIAARYGISFTVGEHSARHLRRILRAYLIAWEMQELNDAAGLALTELVANVVRHVPERRAALLMLWSADGVRVEVTDTCPRPPLSTAVDELGEGGRGLVIVEAVTDRWGWTPLPGRAGKTVWFECHVKRDPPPGGGGRWA
ncbi:ATP-binding protein [Streptomyces sp. NBC_00620]|uniref:ATP-binding protein n=1 Tax=Streptomyces sp. NBC_00620 TaxID=2903666 RepID=UPI00224D1027|nr:ATP-binding protein [Streptomyces sp. NBC_00620]MCX4972897.1 ATP-binding protein [Streptomyces sp. NBC_00620]